MKEHQELFNHLSDQHDLILVESELQEIVNIVYRTNHINPSCEIGLYYETCKEYQVGGNCNQCDYYQ